MSESAGRVLMIPKGTYSPTTTYDPLDAVKYEQNSYVCKQTSRGNLPTNTTYWQPLTDVTADEVPTEDSTNLVQSGGVYSAIDSVNQTLTSAFVNNVNVNGCKNVLTLLTIEQLRKSNVYGTWNGNTYTYNNVVWSFEVDDNGFVTGYSASGTASGSTYGGASPLIITQRNKAEAYELFNLISSNEYVITGRSSGNPVIVVDWSNGSTIVSTTLPNNGDKLVPPSDANNIQLMFYVTKGQTAVSGTFHPMLCLKSDYDLDSTYVPPSKTNRQLTEDSVTWDNLSEVGAVNMLPNNATSIVANGVTFTVNDDGTVTANGKSTAFTSLVIAQHGEASFFDDFIGKPIKLSGCPSGGASNTYELRFDYVSGNYVDDIGDGVIITPTSANSNTWYVEIGISGGVTVSNLTFKPMITAPSYNGPYVPYAKTNKELTEDVANYKTGDIISFSGSLVMVGVANAAGTGFSCSVNLPKEVTSPVTVSSHTETIEWVRGNGTSITTGLSITSVALQRLNRLEFSVSGTFTPLQVYALSLSNVSVTV